MSIIDYKDGIVEWNLLDEIDFTKSYLFRTEGYLSQDILQVKYSHCIIDLGWYGADNGHFTIMVIIPEENGKYRADSWGYPFAKIPCENHYDMFAQLQRAINFYPEIAKDYFKQLESK